MPNSTAFLMAALPPLQGREEGASYSLAELHCLVQGERLLPLLEALLLAEDLRIAQSIAAGQAAEELPEPVIMTAAQVRGEEPLDAPWAQEEGDARWLAYWEWLRDLAQAYPSPLLADWVASEALFHGSILTWRAQVQGRDATWPARLQDLASKDPHDSALAAELANLLRQDADPLNLQRHVDELRWRWLEERSPSYTFRDDEVLMYAARLALVTRWQRITSRVATPAAVGGDSPGARP